MARRTSALEVKRQLANLREHKRSLVEPEDQNLVRERSRDYKPTYSARRVIQIDVFNRLLADAVHKGNVGRAYEMLDARNARVDYLPKHHKRVALKPDVSLVRKRHNVSCLTTACTCCHPQCSNGWEPSNDLCVLRPAHAQGGRPAVLALG
jgi:hypothetical protein